MDDEKIVELYWVREDRAISETSAKYGAYLTRISMNVLASEPDAQECVNDTYLAAWNAMPPHRPGALAVFLGKLTRRISINRFRSRIALRRGGGQAAVCLDELAECVPAGSDTQRAVEITELARAVDGFLAAIPDRQQAIFVRRYWYLEPIAHIARDAGMTENAVKVSLHRTREKLREYLSKEGWI